MEEFRNEFSRKIPRVVLGVKPEGFWMKFLEFHEKSREELPEEFQKKYLRALWEESMEGEKKSS